MAALSSLQALAYPGVLCLVAFLAYSSQWLFFAIEPGPLRKGDSYLFNGLVACLILCYTRTCFTDPGRVPANWHTELIKDVKQSARYCRRCEQPKPPRSHHCKTCNRCVPKMDHHCVWTANCVSHVTLPHFVRFLAYSVASMAYLEYFLYIRCKVIWDNRRLPSYLGPSISQLVHLFVLVVTNSLVLLALTILLGQTVKGLATNVTTIEGWELERHTSNVRRARAMGGFLYAPDGSKVRIEKQEYPWDIGFFSNICQGMGTWNPISWVSPLAWSPPLITGLSFKHNEIEDPRKPWPPPDPDRMFRAPVKIDGEPFTQPMDVESFRARQAADLQRFSGETVVRRKPFAERYQHVQRNDESAVTTDEGSDSDDHEYLGAGEESWANGEGERLADFGVDEDIEFYDEDDVPLSELIRQKQSGRA